VRRFIQLSMLLSTAIVIWGCTYKSAEEIEYQQSFAAGKAYYMDECARCHQKNGEGLGTLYPPLTNADYLKNYPEKLGCIIYNGIRGPITVNNKQYNWPMPGHVNMDDDELAVLLTYIQSNWGNNKRKVTVDQARSIIIECRMKNGNK
jgi:cytochrome c551